MKKYIEQNAQQILDTLVGEHVENPYKDDVPDLSIPLGYFLRHDGKFKIHIFQRVLEGKTTLCKKIHSIIATITHFHFIRETPKSTTFTQTNSFDTKIGQQLAEQIANNITTQINDLQTQINNAADLFEQEDSTTIEHEDSTTIEHEDFTSIEKEVFNTFEKEAINTIEKEDYNSLEKENNSLEKEAFNSLEKEAFNTIEKEDYNSLEKEAFNSLEKEDSTI